MDLVLEDPEEIMRIADALSSMTRINILKIVAESPKSVTELSEELQMTKGNVSSQLALLESAGLIEVEYSNGVKGIKKMVKNKYDKIIINLKSST
ncbi:MAG: ArsR family transcriptional regulator [Candidatus Aramenus sp.]|nr:ArsR family transcriptional regulator [Candidatus Aramenus sp.]